MRGLILFIFYLLPALTLSGQDMQWSSPTKSGERVVAAETIGKTEEGIFLIKKPAGQSRNILLERYNEDMKLEKSKPFFTKKDEFYAQAVMTSKEIQLYWVLHDRDKKEIQVWLQFVDFKFEPLGTDSMLFSFPDGDFNEKYFQVYRPRSSPSILFVYTSQSVEIPSQFSYYMMDTSLQLLHKGIFNIDIATGYEIEDAAFIDNHFAMLVRQDVKKKLSRLGFQYTICHGRFGDASFGQTPLFNDSLTVTDGKIKTDYLNDALVFAGIYELKDSSYAKGYSVWRSGIYARMATWENHSFPAAVIADMAGKTARVQGLYNLRVGDILFRKDGGVVMTCEEYQETREAVADMTMYGISQNNFRYYYYFQNMLLLSVNRNGSVQWHSVLRKDQVSVNDDGMFSSYALAAMADKIVYVYNDLSRKSWNLSLYEVNADGLVSNRIIIRAQEYEARLMPQYGAQLSYNELVIPGLDRRGQVLLKVKL